MGSIDRRVILAGAGLAGVAALSRMAKAGPLEPPQGPIQPTGRTLQEIYDKIARGGPSGTPEARIPIQGLTGTPTALYCIKQPGCYYLTGNVQGVPGKCAIEVYADQVEIECDGFTFIGTQGTLACIRTPSSQRCIGIYDGGFQQWHGMCVDLSSSSDCICEELVFDSCVGTSPDPVTPPATCVMGPGGVAYDCDVRKCFGATIAVGQNGIIEECACSDGGGGSPCFFSSGDAVIEDNFALNCDGPAIVVQGKGVVLYNRVCTCPSGVYVVGRCSVVAENDIDISPGSTGNGISIGGQRSCVCDNYLAGGGGGGAGIAVLVGGDGTLIEGNHVVGGDSSTGAVASGFMYIQPGVTRCHVVSNHHRGLSTSSAFYIPPGNSYGPLVVVSGDLSQVSNSAHPLANTVG